MNHKIYKFLLGVSTIGLVIFFILWGLGLGANMGLLLTLVFVGFAVAFQGFDVLNSFSYTFWIFAAVSISMYYPVYFREVGGIELKVLIVPLLQIIMFGMGATMSLKDFAGVIKMPYGVFVGLICQLSIMPLIGFGLAYGFGFPPEVAAGIILVGASPSGLASNVMSFIARANLALSVTLTAVATLLAPLITPFLMEMLAGQLIEIDFWAMMWSIMKMVIFPVIAGLVFNAVAVRHIPIFLKILPFVSMTAIAIIITIITAAGRDNLLQIGGLLVVACLIHNLSGYLLGYWACKIIGMDERSCRTIALEVGMQNSGLASGIAAEIGEMATLGLAPAVFGPMMNITGSSLATWWRRMKI